jgi:hypothetical protein
VAAGRSALEFSPQTYGSAMEIIGPFGLQAGPRPARRMVPLNPHVINQGEPYMPTSLAHFAIYFFLFSGFFFLFFFLS